MKRLKRFISFTLGSVVMAQVALAETPPGSGTTGTGSGAASTTQVQQEHLLENPLTATSTGELIASVGRFLIGVSTALVVIFILWGAFQIMTSGGSPERVEKGKKTIFYTILGFVVLLIAGGVASLIANILGGSAVPIDGTTVGEAPITTFEGVIGVLVKISRWMFGILMALSIVMILYSAFLYVLSMGSEDRIKRARETLMYAIIAVAIAVFAGGVGIFIQNFFGVENIGGWTAGSCARMSSGCCPAECTNAGWSCTGQTC